MKSALLFKICTFKSALLYKICTIKSAKFVIYGISMDKIRVDKFCLKTAAVVR